MTGNEEQKRRFYAGVLEDRRFGNAFSEAGSKNAGIFDTKLVADGDDFRVTGQKFYATGALFADIVPIAATGDYKTVLLPESNQSGNDHVILKTDPHGPSRHHRPDGLGGRACAGCAQPQG